MKKRTATASQPFVEHDNTPGVTALIDAMSHPLKPVLEDVRRTILAADKSITEGVKWNSPSFYCHGWFATIGCHKPGQLDVVLHCGAKVQRDCTISDSVDDPEKLLTWPSKDRALLAFKSVEDFRKHQRSFKRVISQWASCQAQ